jgi:hypothetical protein
MTDADAPITLAEARRRAADTACANERELLERTMALWAADVASAKAPLTEASEVLAELDEQVSGASA